MSKRSIPNTIKSELDTAISQAITNTNRELGEQECQFARNRVLTAEKMIKLLLSMQGGSLQKELYDAGINATASAFVQQREKISWTVFEEVFENFNKLHKDKETFKGYHVLAIDGTTVNLARNPKSDTYMNNTADKKGYNQFHVNPLYDVLNKIYLHCVIQPQPKQDEIGALIFMLTWHDFDTKTLIVADRGYESYNVFAHFLERKDMDFPNLSLYGL